MESTFRHVKRLSGRWHRLVGVVASLAIVAACRSDAEGSEPALAEVPENPVASALVLPLDAYSATVEDRQTLEYAEDIAAQPCFADAGIPWEVVPRQDPGITQNGLRYGLNDPLLAAEQGYFVPHSTVAQELLSANRAAADAPPEVLQACLATARAEVGTSEVMVQDLAYVEELARSAWEAAEADSRVQRALTEWSECMADEGFAAADQPDTFAEGVMADRPPSGETEDPVIADAERTAATTDVACKQEVNLVGIWFAVESAYQEQLIEENSEGLEEARDRKNEALERAASIVTTAGDGAG